MTCAVWLASPSRVVVVASPVALASWTTSTFEYARVSGVQLSGTLIVFFYAVYVLLLLLPLPLTSLWAALLSLLLCTLLVRMCLMRVLSVL